MLLRLFNSFFHYIIIFLFISCSNLFSKPKAAGRNSAFYNQYKLTNNKDYIEHLAFLHRSIIKPLEKSLVKLTPKGNVYLNGLINRLQINNELLLNKLDKIEIFLIKNKTPFVFSLPGGKIYISTTLINKYVRYESLLASILSLEMIKSERNYYRKWITIPIGILSVDQAISINRLSIEEKIELDKWAFYVLKRSGFDPYSILSWVQVLNKNALELSTYLGELKKISREETLLKSFIVNIGINRKIEDKQTNSSKEFYHFIDEIKEIDA